VMKIIQLSHLARVAFLFLEFVIGRKIPDIDLLKRPRRQNDSPPVCDEGRSTIL